MERGRERWREEEREKEVNSREGEMEVEERGKLLSAHRGTHQISPCSL